MSWFGRSNGRYVHDYHPFPSEFFFSFPLLPLSLSFLRTVMYVPPSLLASKQAVISAVDSRSGVLGCNTTKGLSQCLPLISAYPKRKLLLSPHKAWRGERVWWVAKFGCSSSLFPSLKPGYASGVSANLHLRFVSYPFTYFHCVLEILP